MSETEPGLEPEVDPWPPPTLCPECPSTDIRVCGAPAKSGFKVWRCMKCHVIGYEGRLVGEAMPDFKEKKARKRRHKARSRSRRMPRPDAV